MSEQPLPLADEIRYTLDPVAWAQERVGMVLDPWQVDALTSERARLILLTGRQCGKSTVSSLAATHNAIYRPGSLSILISASERQAKIVHGMVRDYVNKLGIGPDMRENNKLSAEFPNGSKIVALPANEATVRGFPGVSLLVIDEAAKVDDSLYFAARPFLATTNGKLLVMSTAFGQSGFFYDEWTDGGPGWHRIKIKSCEVPRISEEFLANERASMGDAWYRQEYECEFMGVEAGLFTSEQINNIFSKSIKPLAISGW